MGALLRYAIPIVCAVVIGVMSANAAFAERRVALVVGNADYEHADRLTSTINDASVIAALLTKAGFDVVDTRRNVGVVEFKRAVRDFLDTASDADVAVVYYSGHGMEVEGVNYLIPIDAKLAKVWDADDEAVSLDRVLLATEPAKKLRLIILDACRDNPFLRAQGRLPQTRSVASRLIGVSPTSGNTLIAYAAKAGSLSYDGTGPNSPFTAALVKYIAQPGLDIRIALGKVRDDVMASTGNRQEPFVYGSLGGGDISLVPAVSPAIAPVASAPTASDPNLSAASDYEKAERVGTPDAWRAFLGAHDSGYYAELARAQLEKLPVATAQKSDAFVASTGTKTGSGRFPLAPQQAGDDASRLEAALNPNVAPKPDQECKRDAARLAILRSNPSLEQVTQLAQGLGCESLRPQVRRLMESLGIEPIAALPSEPPVTQAQQSPAESRDQACRREEGMLARLRAKPDEGQIVQLERELACEDLRPQVHRLIESLGMKPIGPLSAPAPAAERISTAVPPAAGSPTSEPAAADPVDGAQVCKQEAEELARLRANPQRASAERFARDLKCNSLKAQAADLNQVATPEDAAALLTRWGVTHVEFTHDVAKLGTKPLGEFLAAHCERIAQLGSLDVYDVRSPH